MSDRDDEPPVVRIDPKTGLRVGPATPEEAAAYRAQPVHPVPMADFHRKAFRDPIRVGAYLLDADFGPGVWNGGAGF